MEPDAGPPWPVAGSMLSRATPETRVTTTTMSDVQALHEQQSQQARDQAQQARDQAQQARDQIREQAQQIREQAQRIREEAQEAAREAQRAAEEAAREARAEAGQDVRVIRLPPPPTPPGQEPHIGIPPWQHEPSIPGEVVDIVGMLTFATAAVLILRPLMRAFANRFERRGAPPTALPVEVTAHMDRLE